MKTLITILFALFLLAFFVACIPVIIGIIVIAYLLIFPLTVLADLPNSLNPKTNWPYGMIIWFALATFILLTKDCAFMRYYY